MLERGGTGDLAGNVAHGQAVKALDALLALTACLADTDDQETI